MAMGLSPIFVRWADVGPFTSAFWRVAIALPALYLWMRLSEAQRATPSQPFSRPTIWCGLAFFGDLLFWHLAIMTTSVANATFFATTAPIWVVVFSWLLFRQRTTVATLWGLALCVAGGAALVSRSLHLGGMGAVGDLYGLITGVFFGLYFIAVKAARADSGAARVIFESTLITAACLLLVSAIFERQMLPRSLHGLEVLIALGWISHAGGQGLLSVALGRLSATFASLVIFLEAIAAAGFAWLLLAEPVSPLQAAGGVAILAGIYVARPR